MALVTASSTNFDLAPFDHVIGYYIYDAMEKDVASIKDLLVDKETRKPRYAVIEIGGMMSIQGNKILIPWKALRRGGISRMDVNMPSEQIQMAPLPHFQLEPTRVEEESIHDFFNVMPYWLDPPEPEFIPSAKGIVEKKSDTLPEEITEKFEMEKDE